MIIDFNDLNILAFYHRCMSADIDRIRHLRKQYWLLEYIYLPMIIGSSVLVLIVSLINFKRCYFFLCCCLIL